MQKRALIFIITIGFMSGCSPASERETFEDQTPDQHINCAAVIGAASNLIVTAQAKPDEIITKHELFASMYHLNAWAAPANISEKQAFDKVNAERKRISSSLSVAEILSQAHGCIDQVKTLDEGQAS